MQIDVYDATNILLSMIPAEVGTKRIIDIRQDFAEICAELQEFQPTLLASYPYMLWLLAEAQTDPGGPLNIRPQRITSSADVLNQSDRTTIRAAFGVDHHRPHVEAAALLEVDPVEAAMRGPDLILASDRLADDLQVSDNGIAR